MSRKTFGRFIVKLLVALSFCAVTAYALFLAYGYDYDLGQRHIKKTSIVDLATENSNVSLTLNELKLDQADLPYQFKDVLPGQYNLEIAKEGFITWRKKLLVLTDYVTKVSDIFLFPKDLELFHKNLVKFVDDTQFYFKGSDLVVVKRNQNYITLVTFRDDGTIQEDELKLKFNNLESIDILLHQRFLLHFKDGTVQFIDRNKAKDFVVTALNDADEVNFSVDEDNVYYLKKGFLYKADFNPFMAAVPLKVAPGIKLKGDVTHYSLSSDGIYYISQGRLFWMNRYGQDVKLIDRALNRYLNLFFMRGAGKDFLLLRTNEQKLIYAIDDSLHLHLVAGNIKSDAFLNRLGQVLYQDVDNNIFVYDFRTEKNQLVQHINVDFNLIGWFGDYHFIYSDGNFNLADLDFMNVYKLFPKELNSEIFIQNRALFLLKQGTLDSYYWDKN